MHRLVNTFYKHYDDNNKNNNNNNKKKYYLNEKDWKNVSPMETHAVIFYFDKNIHLIRLFYTRMIVEKRPTPLTWMALMPRECTSWVGEKKLSSYFLAFMKALLRASEMAVKPW